MSFNKDKGPGYQGSEKDGVEVTIYTHGSDPVFGGPGGPIVLNGAIRDGAKSTISNLSWGKSIGEPAGTFSFDVKTKDPVLWRRGVNDDDWVDIVMTDHARKYHVCRGLITNIRENRTVNGGADQKVFSVSGMDFGKIWVTTQIFFNLWAGETGGAILNRFAANAALFRGVDKTVEAFLFLFLKELGGASYARYALPEGMPGITSSDSTARQFFADHVRFAAYRYNDNLEHGLPEMERTAFNANLINPARFSGQYLWNLAKEWSDPVFCELFTDLVMKDSGLQPKPGQECTPDKTQMAVIVRDKPFYTSVRDNDWFFSPLFTVSRQEIVTDNTGRGGDERFNTFFVKTPAVAAFSGANIQITKPLWDPTDVSIRGMRMMECFTNYHHRRSDNNGMVTAMRLLARDWYGLNPYFTNGTLTLGRGRPDIRIGNRLRVPGRSREEDQTYYVEGVNHSWSLDGAKTSLVVTRGWTGTDRSLKDAVDALIDRYVLPDKFPDEPGALDLLGRQVLV